MKDSENKSMKINLTQEQLKEFKSLLKVGIYKQMHKDKMLTDSQLKQLIKLNSH